AQADIGVSPYCGWPEFSGLKILDYKAAGLPTIASGQDGQPVTLRHEETGLIVPPCDGAALQTAIVRLCADAPLRRRLGQTARLEAERQHTWQHTVNRIEQVMLAAVKRD
ncbi:glycosyltransferase family 4 protein, partial [Arthrospira platensis SPKY1]|nr:glycosyltransferase family 4 protein [Arthrospira platensis SPKY1]